jgi:phosphomethylpyrimidine synthase
MLSGEPVMTTKAKNRSPERIGQGRRAVGSAVYPLAKIYVQGSRPDIRVPMREISLDVTPTDFGGEINAPVTGLRHLRPVHRPQRHHRRAQRPGRCALAWIDDRGDTERLPA